MSDRTGIAWTDHTWNPWQGCTKVSPGCAHCYMYGEKTRYGDDPSVVVRSKPPTFRRPFKWTEPARVFTCSWSDFFHEAADPWRTEAWDIIRATPHLTYQILTKRPERIADHLPEDWPFANVWLGTSVEYQRWAEERIHQVLLTEPAVAFVSAEPLLGPLDLIPWLQPADGMAGLAWVIVGGESGPERRPMDHAWARNLRDQCASAGVAFFMKQDAARRSGVTATLPPDLRIQEFPS